MCAPRPAPTRSLWSRFHAAALRNYIAKGGAAHVSHTLLGRAPNLGVFAIDALRRREYGGRGTLPSKLDSCASETTPGVPFLTLRSDGYDLYAQPDGAFYQLSRRPTN
jgi:hypothetical protein